ncbi:hypothetical protein EJB05_45963, partial [Eragrostis curvula]
MEATGSRKKLYASIHHVWPIIHFWKQTDKPDIDCNKFRKLHKIPSSVLAAAEVGEQTVLAAAELERQQVLAAAVPEGRLPQAGRH